MNVKGSFLFDDKKCGAFFLVFLQLNIGTVKFLFNLKTENKWWFAQSICFLIYSQNTNK